VRLPPRGLDDPAAAEGRVGASGAQVNLVRVVMEDAAEFVAIEPRQTAGDRLGDAVTQRIRMADSLPLDELGVPVSDGVAVDGRD